MSPSQIIVLATPVFFLLIAIEFAWARARERKGAGRNTYRLNDAINSVSLGILSQISAVFTRLLRVGIYSAVYASVALYPYEAFWTTWYGWLLALDLLGSEPKFSQPKADPSGATHGVAEKLVSDPNKSLAAPRGP